MALVWIAWIAHLWPRLRVRFIQHVFSAMLVPPLVFSGVWLVSGMWLTAWNALNVTTKPLPVIGLVIGKTMPSGRGGPAYHITVHDISDQRPVEFSVPQRFTKASGAGTRQGLSRARVASASISGLMDGSRHE